MPFKYDNVKDPSLNIYEDGDNARIHCLTNTHTYLHTCTWICSCNRRIVGFQRRDRKIENIVKPHGEGIVEPLIKNYLNIRLKDQRGIM